jgi:hypothetical protein
MFHQLIVLYFLAAVPLVRVSQTMVLVPQVVRQPLFSGTQAEQEK